jgi:serine/threonine protein kinase
MVMEFCSRGSLYDILKDENYAFDWPKVLKIATEAVKGVSCLHSWKPQIVHRDLKSLNLLVS